MSDHYIINGKKYVLAEEEKKPERLMGWVRRVNYDGTAILSNHSAGGYFDTRMVELKEGEVIVSRDDVESAWVEILGAKDKYFNDFMKELGI